MKLDPKHIKPIPKSVLIFGASGHIGRPMAEFLRFHAPEMRLRLASSRPEGMAALQSAFPDAEIVQVSYSDPARMTAAFSGIEAALVVTPPECDELSAMTNVVNAVRKAGTLQHLIRVVGLQPDMNHARVPEKMRSFGKGIEVQHPIARQVLDDADLPVTYLNSGASFMDNLLRLAGQVQAGYLAWPNRPVTYIDPREIGEVAARLLLSEDARHIFQFYTMNNGEEPRSASDVAALMEDVLLRKIPHDPSKEGFLAYFQPLVDGGAMPAHFPDYLWDFFEYEAANATVWVPNQFMERTLGRKPNTLRAWLMEHRAMFQPDADDAAPDVIMPNTSLPTYSDGKPDGVWDFAVATPMGQEPHEMTIKTHADGTLTGEVRHLKNGTVMQIEEGRHSGNTLTWKMRMEKPIKVKLSVAIQVDGNTLSGGAKAGLFGKAKISGQRITELV